MLGYLVSELWGASYFNFPSPKIIGTYHHPQAFVHFAGNKLSSLCLCYKHFAHRAFAPVLRQIA